MLEGKDRTLKNMFNKLHFKPCYSVETVEPDRVFFLSERESICLNDRFTYLNATLVNGDRNSVQ